jgi:hypothetical protein
LLRNLQYTRSRDRCQVQKIAPEGAICYFGLQGITTPELQFLRLLVRNAGRLRRREFRNTRMYLRLHLRFLLDLQSSPTVLPSLLSHPVETGRAH